MRDWLSPVQLGTYALLVACLSPLVVCIGLLWGWTLGVAAFALVAVPACATALSRNRRAALSMALLAGMAGCAEIYLIESHSAANFWFAVSLLGTCVFLAVHGMAVTMAGQLSQRVERLEEQNSKYVRDLYDRDRQAEKAKEESAKADEYSKAKKEGDPADAAENESINYGMLLLAVQDMGQRVSTNLDLESLIPTIISAAKASLKCRQCQIYYWNQQDQTLVNAAPTEQSDSVNYIPNPQAGMAGWVISKRQILTRKDVGRDYSMQSLLTEDPDMPDAIAPLTVGGELLGLLVIDQVEQDSPTIVRLLYILANNCALGIKNAQLFKRIEDMARHDGLTGLLNHASFQQELDRLVDEASSASNPLTVVMSDVDHFKKFNDTYGHQAGDHVLREVAKLIKAVMPDSAVVARYGGEEFICALPDSDIGRGRELAELLREHLEAQTLDFQGQQLSVTASLGVAEWSRRIQAPGELVKLADEALYKAKAAGRNRVVTSVEEDMSDQNTLTGVNSKTIS